MPHTLYWIAGFVAAYALYQFVSADDRDPPSPTHFQSHHERFRLERPQASHHEHPRREHHQAPDCVRLPASHQEHTHREHHQALHSVRPQASHLEHPHHEHHPAPHHEHLYRECPRDEHPHHESPHHEPPHHIPHHDLPRDPASLRALAQQEGNLMKLCLQQSQEAYQRRDHVLAKSLSKKGRRHELKMEQLHAEASDIIFKKNNQDQHPSRVDLHGLYVKEAIKYTEEFLVNARQRGDSVVRLIVGQGNHSDGGIPKLKPTMLEAMEIRGLEVEVDPGNPGVLVVVLDD